MALLALLFFFSSQAIAEKKVLPAYLQKAYILQKQSIIYTRPDFDSLQITRIPSGSMVTISKKIYKSKTGFGTFYKIYLAQPKKIKAYISEVDVVPRYLRSNAKKLNPAFNQVTKKLKLITEEEAPFQEQRTDLGPPVISEKRFLGLTASYKILRDLAESRRAWFFYLHFSEGSFPFQKTSTDLRLGFSTTPPVIRGNLRKRGFYLSSQAFLKRALIESPFLAWHIGAGPALNWKKALPPDDSAFSELSVGVSALTSALIRINERFFITGELTLQKYFEEEKMSYGMGFGILTAI